MLHIHVDQFEFLNRATSSKVVLANQLTEPFSHRNRQLYFTRVATATKLNEVNSMSYMSTCTVLSLGLLPHPKQMLLHI